jgi:hypothetical protein
VTFEPRSLSTSASPRTKRFVAPDHSSGEEQPLTAVELPGGIWYFPPSTGRRRHRKHRSKESKAPAPASIGPSPEPRRPVPGRRHQRKRKAPSPVAPSPIVVPATVLEPVVVDRLCQALLQRPASIPRPPRIRRRCLPINPPDTRPQSSLKFPPSRQGHAVTATLASQSPFVPLLGSTHVLAIAGTERAGVSRAKDGRKATAPRRSRSKSCTSTSAR